MKTYWDLSEKERAALTGEEVEKFGDAELMTKGVLKVTAPVLEPVPAAPEPDLDVFSVSANHGRVDVVFSTAEEARAFVALKPLVREHHYHDGGFIHYVDEAGTDTWKISAERANSKALADARKHEFIAAKDVKARNEKLTEEFDKALKAQQEALADMWSDWRDCGLKANRMQKIADTFASYTQVAEGDANIAFKFLRRVFTDEQIVEAADWGAVEIPNRFHRTRDDRIEAYPEVAAHEESAPAENCIR